MRVKVSQQRLKEVDVFFTGNLVVHKTNGQIMMVERPLKGRFYGVVIESEGDGLKRGNTATYDRKDFEQFYGSVSLIKEV